MAARRLLLSLLLLLLAAAAEAQAPRAIADVVRDADGDGLPDALGQTVTVAGRALADGGALGRAGPWTALRGRRRSLALGPAPGAPAVAAGDSVVARGVLTSAAGMARLA